MAGNKLVAVFNVESYFISAFKPAQEREFVEACARVVSRCFAGTVTSDLVHA